LGHGALGHKILFSVAPCDILHLDGASCEIGEAPLSNPGWIDSAGCGTWSCHQPGYPRRIRVRGQSAIRLCTAGPHQGRHRRGKSPPEKVLSMLRSAEGKFLYLWEGCHADVESAKRSSVLMVLLSVITVAYGTSSMYTLSCTDRDVTLVTCSLEAVDRLLVTLAVDVSLCTVLYFLSSLVERTLASRRICWKYFCYRLEHQLEKDCSG
jgi:hypothetical protein